MRNSRPPSALTFRIALANMFFAGDLYSGAGVVIDPNHPPQVGDSLEQIALSLRSKPFSEYFTRIFAPYYLKRRPDSTEDSLIAQNRLEVIGDALRGDPDYYAQTNSDELILDKAETRVAGEHPRLENRGLRSRRTPGQPR